MGQIIHGDCLEELKKLEANSVDLVCTDPPYGYSFMGKDWDKAVPAVEVWQECLRVLKPGAFCMVMSAPRSDVQNAMISRLMEAGFRLDFTPIYWTYASGFPKAGNIGKMVDKRLGAERKVTGVKTEPNGRNRLKESKGVSENKTWGAGQSGFTESVEKRLETAPASDEAKSLDGSYAGFQPKPAVEVIIVAMKPLSEKTFVDQALKNGHGVTWLDDCRIPTNSHDPNTRENSSRNTRNSDGVVFKAHDKNETAGAGSEFSSQGRFPANLLVSDNILEDGNVSRSRTPKIGGADRTFVNTYGGDPQQSTGIRVHGDSGGYSRYFDLDKWAQTLPFLIVPKASKSEKNAGLEPELNLFEHREGFTPKKTNDGRKVDADNAFQRGATERHNHHPTVKPLKLMSYLITLGSRKGDVVLDPFAGSGTTILAAEMLERIGIGIEREAEYVEIAEARLEHEKSKPKQGELL